MASNEPSPSALKAGLAASCPRCGKGPLFLGLANISPRPSCPGCGLDYKFIDTGDGPAVFATFILGFVILGGALYLEFVHEPPFWVHIVVWGVLTPVMALFLLRFLKAYLTALQFKYKAEEGRLVKK